MKLTLANTAWFVLVWLFYLALPEWREVLPALILAILLWRIQEIARFRPDWSWLEKWPFLLKLEKGKITGYHLSGGGALTVCFLLTPPEMSQIEFLWQGGLLIALLGYTSNHFYHVAFMYPHDREYDMLLHGLVPNKWRRRIAVLWAA